MYNSNEFDSHINTEQITSTPSHSLTSKPSLGEGVFTILIPIGIIVFVIHAIVLVIWLRSMLAMIALNEKFKDFYEEYLSNEYVKNAMKQPESAASQELRVEPLHENSNTQALKKDDEQLSDASWFTRNRKTISIFVLASLLALMFIILVTYRTQTLYVLFR